MKIDGDKKVSDLQFWQNNKYNYPELYVLSQIVFAAPATQVSVERLFSALRFIFSRLRSRLSGNIINDILIIRMNSIDLAEEEKVIG